jgi:SAM-dependent methyltransferase
MIANVPTESKGGYDPAHFANLVEVEDRHFWFRARNRVIAALLRRLTADLAPGYRVLEVGCGDGNVLRFLEQAAAAGLVVGMDLYREGLNYAHRRSGCSLVQGDVNQCPFGKPFDFVGIFDVLEHIDDDHGALMQLRSLLAPGGKLLITVPAHRRLWSYFDHASGHCRRYELNELCDKLARAGYQVEYVTPYMSILYPLMWLMRKSKQPAPAMSDEALVRRELRVVPLLNGLLAALLSPEVRWIARRKRLPFGTSLVALARKAP